MSRQGRRVRDVELEILDRLRPILSRLADTKDEKTRIRILEFAIRRSGIAWEFLEAVRRIYGVPATLHVPQQAEDAAGARLWRSV